MKEFLRLWGKRKEVVQLAGSAEEIILENINAIKEWALSGMAEKEMSEMLGIAYSTFRKIKQSNMVLSAVLAEAKKHRSDILKDQVKTVEASLYKRCLGYNAKVMKYYKVKKAVFDESGQVIFDKGGKAVMEETLEERTEETHVPADISAVKFFLLNKARKEWRNDPERLEIDKKRLANDTKRTKIAEQASGGGEEKKSIESYLDQAEREANE
ncbi:MAG: hypothetical protein VB047_12020 [Anaerotignum propionicum]|uniref:hypothetical protein n=1 Tax=Anaerotignum propionicum TaxID=28446 RepID=UPI002B1F08E6|nr:hypothetical protein [Anaerotignum propionicum]MEA5058265.1 hypothetical protein [Anaerotignum propionicum]